MGWSSLQRALKRPVIARAAVGSGLMSMAILRTLTQRQWTERHAIVETHHSSPASSLPLFYTYYHEQGRYAYFYFSISISIQYDCKVHFFINVSSTGHVILQGSSISVYIFNHTMLLTRVAGCLRSPHAGRSHTDRWFRAGLSVSSFLICFSSFLICFDVLFYFISCKYDDCLEE